ncbi:hypothetical protein NDU88_000596 [Pleurodeles waltl]|uniref:Uncharacterized protein n=1 Tax=Pleurodeles waltl TaxID=8319 RepID=A0AAV7S536_PLEWA|nr:hypothetical protein NDU88_000596 [Pleurodeles waltl]
MPAQAASQAKFDAAYVMTTDAAGGSGTGGRGKAKMRVVPEQRSLSMRWQHASEVAKREPKAASALPLWSAKARPDTHGLTVCSRMESSASTLKGHVVEREGLQLRDDCAVTSLTQMGKQDLRGSTGMEGVLAAYKATNSREGHQVSSNASYAQGKKPAIQQCQQSKQGALKEALMAQAAGELKERQ